MKNLGYITILLIVIAGAAYAPARADVMTPVSKYRKILLLNGDWKYTKEDRPEFSDPGFDDSKWETVQTPRKEGRGAKNADGWYRKTFTPAKGVFYEWLRFDRILDEGEVWLNGKKLINPEYEEPLEDRQTGIYNHVWTFDWPEFFRTMNLIRYGAKNTIAVRVTDDPATSAPGIDVLDEPTGEKVSGILGNIMLAARPEVYIKTIERIEPDSIKNGHVSHVFRAAVGAASLNRKKCSLKLTIYSTDGAKKFEKIMPAVAGPNGSVVEFRWETPPRYETYRATLHLNDSEGHNDEINLSFHGMFVNTSGKDLFVNGQPYTIKGIEELPGIKKSAGSKRTEYKSIWARMDLNKIAETGFNTIRVADPPQSVVREAEKLGIMVVPIIRDKLWARTILALREFPNILYWDIDTPNSGDLPEMLQAISTLDHYKRPIAYSGTLEPDLSIKPFSMIDIRGVGPSKKYAAVCGSAPLGDRINRVVVLTGWGVSPKVRDKYAAARSAPELIRTWKMCAGAGKTEGAFYAHLYGPDTRTPALRDTVSMKWDGVMLDVMKNIFGEFDTTASKNSSGGVRVGFKYLGTPAAYNIKAYSAGAAPKLIDKQALLRKDQVFFVNQPGMNDKLSSMTIKYETNGGVPREFDFDGGAAVFDPSAASFDSKDISFKKNERKQLRIRIDGGGVPCEADVSLASDTTGVDIDPRRRSVSIPAADSVLAPFSVSPSAARAPFLLTCIIKFTDSPRPAIKIYAVADPE